MATTSTDDTKTQERQFGAWLDVTLSNKRLRGRDLALAVGVHDSAVSRWRAGRSVPNMAVCTRLAEILEVDALRLAVTAGHVPAEVAGVEPFPVPEATALRESIMRQISAIKGLTKKDQQRLIEAYEKGE